VKIKMHPVTYAQMLKWTAKEIDGISLLGSPNETGLRGLLDMLGKKRDLHVDMGYPKEGVVIECSIGELRTMINRGEEPTHKEIV